MLPGLFALTILLVSLLAFADEPRIFRIGTGEIGGTYYPIGGIIASAISSPPKRVLAIKAVAAVCQDWSRSRRHPMGLLRMLSL